MIQNLRIYLTSRRNSAKYLTALFAPYVAAVTAPQRPASDVECEKVAA